MKSNGSDLYFTDNNIKSVIKLASTAGDVDGDVGDGTNRIVFNTWQQSNKAKPYGDITRILEEHGSAKGGHKWYLRGLPAEIISTNSAPFAVTTGQTLQIKVNGGPTVTVTFSPAVSGSATANEISDAICKQVNYTSYPTGLVSADYWCQAIEYYTQTGSSVPADNVKLAIYSCALGATASLEIVGGTALTALGISVGTVLGTAGVTDLGVQGMGTQLAWIIAHLNPNNPASNNAHNHLSIEVPDASGEMQTRLSIQVFRDVAQMLISSSMLILDTYPLTISSSANSNKDLDFSRDNTGRQISRVFQFRTGPDSSGGNMGFRVFDDAGVVTEVITINRLSKFMAMKCAIQQQIRSTANTAQTTMTLTPSFGNAFVLSGTGTVQYIANTNWQAGSEITVILQGAATLTHAAGSPTGTNRPLKLSGSADFTAGANGSAHKFIYDGSGYSNNWIEISRITF